MQNRWQEIEALYHAALDQPAEERAAILAAADESVRAAVKALLAQDANSGVLDRTGPAVADAAPTPAIGSQIGPYTIEEQIGKGGMGEVFRARDTRLQRDVAIKACDVRFVERFEREARAISALNHTNICTLFDVGPNYLVMELVEGETLEERIQRGAIPPEEALAIARQIAEALEAAHERGIVHRDLKPANIKIRPDGRVKVLDFGLAKFGDSPEDAGREEDATEPGMILGTAAYMAPEQARGKKIDKRADIWAFGVVLHEMLTGRRLFKREDAAGTLAAILNDTPALGATPPKVRRLLARCLEKDPTKRLRDIGDAWELIEEPAAAPVKRQWRAAVIATIGVGIVAMAAAWYVGGSEDAAALKRLNVSIAPPPNTSFRVASNFDGGFALSPDGTMLAFVGRTNGVARLWVRRLDAPEARSLPGTETAYFPFWSPDSKSIGFFTTAPPQLKRYDLKGDSVRMISNVGRVSAGGSWGPDGTIVLGAVTETYRVPAIGGALVKIPDAGGGRFPHFLPDGKRFVYASGTNTGAARMTLGSLEPGFKPRVLGDTDVRWPHYSMGHLLFFSGGSLQAQSFDLDRGQTTGDPFPLTDIAHRTFVGTMLADFSVTAQGVLVYPSMAHVNSNLVWRDRSGRILRKSVIAAGYHSPRISPEGTRVAFGKYDGTNTDIWIEDLAGQTLTRFTFGAGIEQHPTWSPEGETIFYTSDEGGRANLYRRLASGGGEPTRISESPYEQQAMDWASDGSGLLYTQIRQSAEIMARPTSGGRDMSFLGHALGATGPQFNPGVPRWISYSYDDSGRRETYVQGLASGKQASSARWQISDEGGYAARWRGDGKELFYISLDGRMNAVAVDGSGAAFRSSKPVELFRTSPPQMRHPDFTFDVTQDGQQFVIIEPAHDLELLPLTLVTGWATLR